MKPTPLLLYAVLGLISGLSTSDLVAEQHVIQIRPLVRPDTTRSSSLNFNARKTETAPPAQVSPNRGVEVQPVAPVAELTYIAVIGAVSSPAVFETPAASVSLRTLIQNAGGVTAESLGSVRILERGIARSTISLQGNLDRPIENGQVVFVTPRGGLPSHVVDRRKPARQRSVLITGLLRGPLRFNIGQKMMTLRELMVILGQPPELVAQEQVTASAPQGAWLDLDSPLVNDTVIHFQSDVVNLEGVQVALQNGLQFQAPVKLESSSEPTPVNSDSIPASVLQRPAPAKQPIRANPLPIITPAPTTSSRNPSASQGLAGTSIEPAGSDHPWPEPNPFPSSSADTDIPQSEPPATGRVPVLLPQNWTGVSDEQEELEREQAEPDDQARAINRTSASKTPLHSEIVTASAEITESETLSPSRTAMRTPPEEPTPLSELAEVEANQVTASSWTTPGSWLVLSLVVAVTLASVLLTRHLSRKEVTDEDLLEALDGQDEALVKAVSNVEERKIERTNEDEQRFLQRLILNKVTVIEEPAMVPESGRLHGASVGAQRLVVHEAHQEVAGPHFRVRNPSDTRDVELRLRKLMRTEAASTRRSTAVVDTSAVREQRVAAVGPLERALRNVERGVTQ